MKDIPFKQALVFLTIALILITITIAMAFGHRSYGDTSAGFTFSKGIRAMAFIIFRAKDPAGSWEPSNLVKAARGGTMPV